VSLKVALLVSLALACSCLSGCGLLAPSGPSDVARGEYYAAGKPEFDSFFIVLHEKQVQLLGAPGEPADARKNLTQIVGLAPDASDDSLKERLAQELKKLAGQGLRVRLDVPAPSPTVDASATLYASETNTATPLRSALPQEATRLVRSRNRLLDSKTELEKLKVMGITLEGKVDASFRTDGPWKRDEVRKNLADGQKLITLMQARAQDVVDLDQKLLALLTDVASTDPNLGTTPAYAPPPTDESPKPGRRAVATRPAPAPAARPNGAAPPAKPAPASKPAPKPRGDDDAPSAPKPTQGNAPAEIEP
jgi:hypothetical protein